MDYVLAIPLLPMAAFVILTPMSSHARNRARWISLLAILGSLVLSIAAFVAVWQGSSAGGGHGEEAAHGAVELAYHASFTLGTIGGNPLRNEQRNVKLGGTLVVPFRGRHAIKIGYADGIITRFGNDFSQFIVSYSVILK